MLLPLILVYLHYIKDGVDKTWLLVLGFALMLQRTFFVLLFMFVFLIFICCYEENDCILLRFANLDIFCVCVCQL